jgi:RNA polymerase sigma-70 factor (sigma-E family)
VSNGSEFGEFVAHQGPGLLRFARWLTADTDDAEDLLQSALTKTYARWRTVGEDPTRYVRQVMVNRQRDWWRRKRVHAALPVAHPREALPADDVLSEREALKRALLTLTVRERGVVVLKHYYDLSEQQVAAELGIAEGTVKSTNARALAKLRDQLPTRPREAGTPNDH